MRKPTIVKVAVVSAAVGAVAAVAGIALVVRHVRKRRRRKAQAHAKGQFLSDRKRQAITDVIDLAAQDIAHTSVGAALYRNHLQGLSDKRLLTLYAALKVGEYLRDSGIDPAAATVDQLAAIKARFTEIEEGEGNDRQGILSALLSHDVDIKPLLAAALGILALI